MKPEGELPAGFETGQGCGSRARVVVRGRVACSADEVQHSGQVLVDQPGAPHGTDAVGLVQVFVARVGASGSAAREVLGERALLDETRCRIG